MSTQSSKPTRPTVGQQLRQSSSGLRALLTSFAFFGIVTTVVYPRLPARMASHFDGLGQADGYGSPAMNLAFLVFGCVVFVFIFGLLHFGIRQSNPKNMNLPNTARWKDPAERIALRNNLADSMLWLAAASVAFMAVVFVSLCRANQSWSGGLGAEFWFGVAAYGVFMLVWPMLQLRPLFQSEPA